MDSASAAVAGAKNIEIILPPSLKSASGIEKICKKAIHSATAISSGFAKGEWVLRLSHTPISKVKMHRTIPNSGEEKTASI